MSWLRDHFDHLLLALLGIAGALGGLWATQHGLEKAAEWFFMQSGGCVAALLMRMQGPKSGPTPLPTSDPLTPKP